MKRKLVGRLSLSCIAVLGATIGILSSLVPGFGYGVAKAAQPIALVYRGPVVGCTGCSEPVKALLESDTNYDFDVRYVGPNETLSVQAGLALPNVVLYAQPGGDGDLDSAYSRVSSNASAIRNFVQNGGRYLGFCMGGYLVDDDPGYALGINTDQYITSSGATVTTEDDSLVKVLWRGSYRWMYFQDGAYFIPDSGVADQVILAKYTNNKVAAMVQPYGQGKVGVSGPHPEADSSWYNSAGLNDPDGIDADLGHDLIDTLMTGSSVTQSSEKAITSFILKGVTGTINETNHTIAVNLPAGTSVSSLAPTISVSAKASISPASGVSKNFTSPVIYTVTAENGSTQSYVVTVNVAPTLSSAKAIIGFTLAGQTGSVNESSHTITVNLPAGTNASSLAPTISVSTKASVSPASGIIKNFTVPVTYTVTAEDGSTQNYIVTAIVASSKSSAKAITNFVLGGVTGVINEASHTITVNFPAGTQVSSLAPNIYLSVKSSVSPASGTYKNFTNPVVYTVTAEDGSTQAYTVTAIVAATDDGNPTAIISYNVTSPTCSDVIATMLPSENVTVTSAGGVTHVFTENGSFTFTFVDSEGNTGSAVAKVTNIDKIAPTIVLNDNSSLTLATGSTYSESGAIVTDNVDTSLNPIITGSINVNIPGTYIITYTAIDTAGNIAIANRTVKVSNTSDLSANEILSFNFANPNVAGSIDNVNHKIILTVPYGTKITAIVPTITVSDGATINPRSGVVQNFTNPKTYSVTSSDGKTQTYTVTVKVASATANVPTGIVDGDIIQCKDSANPFAVYIVKIVGNKAYIRHIVSLQIFNYYSHLKWANLKQVASLDSFSLSGWVRVNTGTNGTPKSGDKVWEINGDQTKHWINMTAQQFLTHGGSDAAIYTVNQGELDLYVTGSDVMSL